MPEGHDHRPLGHAALSSRRGRRAVVAGQNRRARFTAPPVAVRSPQATPLHRSRARGMPNYTTRRRPAPQRLTIDGLVPRVALLETGQPPYGSYHVWAGSATPVGRGGCEIHASQSTRRDVAEVATQPLTSPTSVELLPTCLSRVVTLVSPRSTGYATTTGSTPRNAGSRRTISGKLGAPALARQVSTPPPRPCTNTRARVVVAAKGSGRPVEILDLCRSDGRVVYAARVVRPSCRSYCMGLT